MMMMIGMFEQDCIFHILMLLRHCMVLICSIKIQKFDQKNDGGGCSRGLLPLYLEGKQLLWESRIFPFHIKTGRDDDDDGGKEDF